MHAETSSVHAMTDDPFGSLKDEVPPSPHEARRILLDGARRGYVPVRNVFVQKDPGPTDRSSSLALFVTNRQERALDALLTLYALQPILTEEDPLPLGAWANILSSRTHCSVTTASKAFRVLDDMGLITRTRRGLTTVLTPLREDGTRQAWTRPGARADDATSGPIQDGPYFTIPHEYWNDGYIDRLKLPGKAMLLIMLKETQGKPAFEMAVDRAQRYYGISERTAERGYLELSKEKLLLVHIQRTASARLPAGLLREVYHRALADPFSTTRRRALQTEAAKRVRRPKKADV